MTSALVVAEGHGWFLRRYDQRRAVHFLNFIHELTNLRIEAFDAHELKRAGARVMKCDDQSLTLADAHGLVIMGTHRIKMCWSTDRHLGLSGAVLVR